MPSSIAFHSVLLCSRPLLDWCRNTQLQYVIMRIYYLLVDRVTAAARCSDSILWLRHILCISSVYHAGPGVHRLYYLHDCILHVLDCTGYWLCCAHHMLWHIRRLVFLEQHTKHGNYYISNYYYNRFTTPHPRHSPGL